MTMVTLKLSPIDTSPNCIPPDVIHSISTNLLNVQDLLSFSLINKHCYNHITNDNNIWINYLRIVNAWSDANENQKTGKSIHDNLIDETDLNPIYCLIHPINDSNLARSTFIKIYSILSPILNDLLIKNYKNFQNLNVFKQYNSPVKQSILFINISNFIKLFKYESYYKSILIRLNNILNLFISSIVKEIDLNLANQNFKVVQTLIQTLNNLSIINNSEIKIDPLNSLLEFFINRYINDYSFLTSNDELIAQLFANNRLNFSEVDNLFDARIKDTLNVQLNEIGSIFDEHRESSEDDEFFIEKNIDEIPIILKIIETFLSSYLIGGLIDKIISKSKQIDQDQLLESNPLISVEENTGTGESIEPGQQQEEQQQEDPNLDDQEQDQKNVWTGEEVKKLTIQDDSNNVEQHNLSNETSLYFQCIPYLHFKLVLTFNNLAYPKSFLADSKELKLDYKTIINDFISFYYEQYLVEFSDLLPVKLHKELKNLLLDWEVKKVDNQKEFENGILKLVDDDIDNSSNNKNIFSNLTSIFKFNQASSTKDQSEPTGIEEQPKLTKLDANLRIITLNIQNLPSLISSDLVDELIKNIQNSFNLLNSLKGNSTNNNTKFNDIYLDIFVDFINLLIDNHLSIGFNECLKRLKIYNLNEIDISDDIKIEPLGSFIELINLGDSILSKVNGFYTSQLSSKPKSKDFLSANRCEKSINKLEFLLDDYFANGLNVSIDIIINEIKIMLINSDLDETTYNNNNSDVSIDKPSTYIQKAIELLQNHFKSIDQSFTNLSNNQIFDIFKEEIGERLIDLLYKLITKKLTISTTGAIQFINDLNFVYNFSTDYKIKKLIAFLKSLKLISQLYLVNCVDEDKKTNASNKKQLGKLVIEIGRNNGFFTPEEVYLFVSRRSDWLIIKKSVDKIMYGFGSDDCIIA